MIVGCQYITMVQTDQYFNRLVIFIYLFF